LQNTLKHKLKNSVLEITWLENRELGTITGSFSVFISEVEVSPISTTCPSIDPACNMESL